MDDREFLAGLQSGNADVRFAAWRAAGDASPSLIPQIGKLAGSRDPGIAKAAREALTTMAHAVGKDASAPNRAGVVRGLIDLAGGSDLGVRVHAIRLLSNIAGEDAVPAIARWFSTPELREEVAYCVERIPGEASNEALMAAYRTAPGDFKPRILAALGHRRAQEAAALCADAMQSSDPQIALAGARALGRIGKKSAAAPGKPDSKELSPWQWVDWMDAMLRYADGRAAEGDAAEAMRMYRTALDRPEEHWQCAAIIGIAKLGTADAAALVMPKLKSGNSKVRITARNAWKSMAAGGS